MSGSRRMAVPASRLRVPDSDASERTHDRRGHRGRRHLRTGIRGRPSARASSGASSSEASLVHHQGLGTLRVGEEAPPDADSVFRIASMTKSFTAATVISLRDEGRLASTIRSRVGCRISLA